MLSYFAIFLVAAIIAWLLTPLAKWASFKLNILDQPGHRKIHDQPIPLLGGVAIFAAFALSLSFSGLVARELAALLAAGLAFVLFGTLDDAGIKVRARYKIWTHLALSFLFIAVSGVAFGLFKYELINWVLTACFITFMTNSMNMLDGMDGLVSGVSFFAAIFFFILALNSGQSDAALLALAVAGVTLGFLRYNFNPASIFLGEAGSTFLGFILAVISLKLEIFQLWNIALLLNLPRLGVIAFFVPLIILGIPIFDTFFVFINRFFHHVKMSTPGKDHSHHRIHLMGLSQRGTVLALYGVQFVLGAIALSLINADLQQFISLVLIVLMMAVAAWVFLSRVEVYEKHPGGGSGLSH